MGGSENVIPVEDTARTDAMPHDARQRFAPASLGADDLEYLVTRIRAARPNVRIRVRGDGGFGNPTMYEASERLDVIYTYGLATNAVLQRESAASLRANPGDVDGHGFRRRSPSSEG